MQTICLEHRISHGTLYQFNMPFPHVDGSQYVRCVVPMVASPGVTYQDILAEVASKKSIDHLETVTIAHHWYVISMSVLGFMSVATNFHHEDGANETISDRMKNLAKELVASRDYEANGGRDRKDHKQWDYWPKD